MGRTLISQADLDRFEAGDTIIVEWIHDRSNARKEERYTVKSVGPRGSLRLSRRRRLTANFGMRTNPNASHKVTTTLGPVKDVRPAVE